MKRSLLSRGALIVFSFFVISLLAASVHSQTETQTAETQKATEPAGKTIFVDNKCSTCHSIQSVGITKKLSSSKAPDLSNVGSERKANWITKWLKKEESLNGKKHQGMFTGKDADLKTLAEWLESLKKPEEKK